MVGGGPMEPSRLATAAEFSSKAFLLVIFAVLATFKAMVVKSQLVSWEPGQGIEKHVELAAQAAALAFLILLVSLILLRFRPKATAKGWEPRVSALIGTFLPLALVALPMADLEPASRILGIWLIL